MEFFKWKRKIENIVWKVQEDFKALKAFRVLEKISPQKLFPRNIEFEI